MNFDDATATAAKVRVGSASARDAVWPNVH